MRKGLEVRWLRPAARPWPAQCWPLLPSSGAPQEAVAYSTADSPTSCRRWTQGPVARSSSDIDSKARRRSSCSRWNRCCSICLRWQLWISMYFGKFTSPPGGRLICGLGGAFLVEPCCTTSPPVVVISLASVFCDSFSHRPISLDSGCVARGTVMLVADSAGEDMDVRILCDSCQTGLPTCSRSFRLEGPVGSAEGGLQVDVASLNGTSGRTPPMVMGWFPKR
mmetsp:Transcript_5596/g.18122  ORF Transcript_5596/g.18122 Transcript_5596/m.18122 type:complete len:223 (+) Transcript_5596:57-725(+)